MKRSSEKLRDYTEVVIEITDSMRFQGSNLSDIAAGDSREWVTIIMEAALAFVDEMKALKPEWYGEWIDCVESYGHQVVSALIESKGTVTILPPWRFIARSLINRHRSDKE
jgi:hypothetical protein